MIILHAAIVAKNKKCVHKFDRIFDFTIITQDHIYAQLPMIGK